MKKTDLPEKLPTLSDEDIVTVGRDRTQRIIRSGKNLTVSLALVATGAAVLPACSDDKNCSDSDYGTTAPYDLGYYADPYDYGQQLTTGDAYGNGDYCRDYD